MRKSKHFLMALLASLCMAQGYSQSVADGCQTEIVDSATFFNWPYFGNNQYLLNLVDSLEGTPASRVIPPILQIPVTAWVYHINNPADNITNNVVEQYINAANQFMINNNSRIRFYLRCAVNHVTDNRFYNDVNEGNTNTLFNTYYTARTMNIHFTNNTGDGFARGRFPWKSNPYACYIPSFWSFVGNNFFAPLANTLTHELGHALGLLHTHDGSRGNKANNAECGDCYQESVSRTRNQGAICISTWGKKKCEVNADALCDTDADPLLLVNNVRYVLAGCAGYDRTGPYQQDRWGSQWLPAGNDNAIRNLMSYSGDNCRTQITPMQRGVQYFYALYKGNFPFGFQFESFYRNEDVDAFENDNFWQNAQPIALNTVQARSLHRVPDQNSAYTGCDVDWVRFVAPCSHSLTVSTSAIAGRVNANTRLTIFNMALTQLAQNDDITPGSNLFSSIAFNFTAGQEYLIRVENMNNAVAGHYNLQIGLTNPLAINGPLSFCTSGVYGIDNLPAGASVTWSANPAIVNFSCNPCAQPTITPSTTGATTLTATVNACGLSLPITKSIHAGTYSSSEYSISGGNNPNGQPYYCLNQSISFSVSGPGGSNYVWSYPTGWSMLYNGGSYCVLRSPSSTSPPTGDITVTFTDPCGAPMTKSKWMAYSGVGCTDPRYTYSPNPAPSYLNMAVASQYLGNTWIRKIQLVQASTGITVYNQDYSFGNVTNTTITMSGFQTGSYTLRIYDGSNWSNYSVMR